jgi:hypothetical protein
LEEKEMRKVVAIMAVLGMAAVPAIAAVGEALPASGALQFSTINAQTGVITPGGGGIRATTIYADLVTSGYFANCGVQGVGPTGNGFADDIHAIPGSPITSVTVGYFVSSTGPGGPGTVPPGNFPMTLSLWLNDATDSLPNGPLGTNMYSNTFNVPGADGFAHAVTITGLSIATTGDFYIQQDWAANGVFRAGPLITGNAGGTVGYSHNAFFYYGSSYSFGSLAGGTILWADFYNAASTPEPLTIGLLAVSGLVVLRRRR